MLPHGSSLHPCGGHAEGLKWLQDRRPWFGSRVEQTVSNLVLSFHFISKKRVHIVMNESQSPSPPLLPLPPCPSSHFYPCLLLLSEKAMASHSSTLAWKIPWTEEPGRLQSMGSRRVRHDCATSLSLFTFKHWRRKWQPTPVFLPGEPQRRGSLVAAVYGVAQSRTRLKRLSSSSSCSCANGTI